MTQPNREEMGGWVLCNYTSVTLASDSAAGAAGMLIRSLIDWVENIHSFKTFRFRNKVPNLTLSSEPDGDTTE